MLPSCMAHDGHSERMPSATHVRVCKFSVTFPGKVRCGYNDVVPLYDMNVNSSDPSHAIVMVPRACLPLCTHV